MTKLRVVQTADGRFGFPEVVLYELISGPLVGTRLVVPPTIESHPDPVSAAPPELSSRASAKHIAAGLAGGWDGRPLALRYRGLPRASLPYRMIVLDQALHDRLRAAGYLAAQGHQDGRFIDNRVAPGPS